MNNIFKKNFLTLNKHSPLYSFLESVQSKLGNLFERLGSCFHVESKRPSVDSVHKV